MRNWWDYHKWYVVCGIGLAMLLAYLIGNACGFLKTKPDLQVAYVGDSALPQDTVTALEQAFASLAWDFNGDGAVAVQVHQYVSNSQSPDGDGMLYAYASEVPLIGDINDCDSYFFIMDDPAQFQRAFHVLALPDGGCPQALDYSTEGKAWAWDQCLGFADVELGTYEETVLGEPVHGDNRDLLEGMYVGRRCFYKDDAVDYEENCRKLWSKILKNE